MNRPRTLVVTGAASGIGAALCERLVATGENVIGLDQQPATAASHHIAVDLASTESIRAALASLPEEIDGLANVAGVPGTRSPATVMAVNLIAPRLLSETLLPRIRRGGALVCVSSITAHRCTWTEAQLEVLLAGGAGGMPSAGSEAYELSKRALNYWLLRNMPRFVAAGVRANLVSPGPVHTPILSDFEASMGRERIAAAAELTGRHGEPGEIADVLCFLLSTQSSWVNGVDIKVDGGFHALRAARELEEKLPASAAEAGRCN